jgi:hypothetical protein
VVVITAPYRTTWATERTPEHLGEDVVRVGTLGRPFSRPEPVKVLTLLGIAQDFIGLLDLSELLRVTAFVGVVLTGKFAIGFLDVIC